MEKSILFIFLLLAFVAIIQAGAISVTPKRTVSEDANIERSGLLQKLRRDRRKIDYYDWEQFLPKKCTDCNILSIGNGYKNTNIVTFNGSKPKDWGFS